MTKTAGLEGTGIIAGDFEAELKGVLSDEEIAEATGVSDESAKKRELLTNVAEILAPINDPAELDRIIARYKQIGDPNYKAEESKHNSTDDDEDDDAFDEDDFFPDRRKEEKRIAAILRAPQKDDDEDENYVITRR